MSTVMTTNIMKLQMHGKEFNAARRFQNLGESDR